MGKKFGWSAKVRNHRTGETGHAHGETKSDDPGYSREQATEDVRNFVREKAREQGHVASAFDIEFYG